MPPSLPSIILGFVILLAGFRLIELARAKERRLKIMRRGFWTDLAYWAFTPLIGRVIVQAGIVVFVLPVVLFIYGKVDPARISHGFGPLSHLPLALQAVILLVLSDFISYWMHRAFHRGALWKFHAVHHSSTDLDWLSAVRVHPVNDLLMRAATVVPVLLIGVAPIAVAGMLPVLTLFAILLHANVDWDWGPLRAVIISPRFHRWHHTSEEAGLDKNFAGLLPLWDILFGTYYMPDARPSEFGVAEPVPSHLIGQLAYPFRGRRPAQPKDVPASPGSAVSASPG